MTMLLMIILAFSTGMYLGLRKKMKFLTKYKILPVLTCTLLFSMGTEIGTSQEIFDNLASIGLHAFLIALFATAGSFLVTLVFVKWFSRSHEKGETDE